MTKVIARLLIELLAGQQEQSNIKILHTSSKKLNWEKHSIKMKRTLKLKKSDFFASRWKNARVLARMNAACLLSLFMKRLIYFTEYYKDTIYDFDYNPFLSILKVSSDLQICQNNKYHIFVRTTNSALWLSLAKLQYYV